VYVPVKHAAPVKHKKSRFARKSLVASCPFGESYLPLVLWGHLLVSRPLGTVTSLLSLGDSYQSLVPWGQLPVSCPLGTVISLLSLGDSYLSLVLRVHVALRPLKKLLQCVPLFHNPHALPCSKDTQHEAVE